MRKVAATLKVRDAANMTQAQWRVFAQWLVDQINAAQHDRDEYGQSYTAKLYRDS